MAITRRVGAFSTVCINLRLAASLVVPLALGWIKYLQSERRGAPDTAVKVLWLSMNSTPASEEADCRCRLEETMALLR